MNALPLLLIGGAAVMMLGGKKKSGGRGYHCKDNLCTVSTMSGAESLIRSRTGERGLILGAYSGPDEAAILKLFRSAAAVEKDLVFVIVRGSMASEASEDVRRDEDVVAELSYGEVSLEAHLTMESTDIRSLEDFRSKLGRAVYEARSGVRAGGNSGPSTGTTGTTGSRPRPSPSAGTKEWGPKPAGMGDTEWKAANMHISVAWEYNDNVGYMTREVYLATHRNLPFPSAEDTGTEAQIWDRIWDYINSQYSKFPKQPSGAQITQIYDVDTLRAWTKDPSPGVILIYLDNPHAGFVPDVVIATDQTDLSFKMLPLLVSSALENVPKHGLRYARVSLSDVPAAADLMIDNSSRISGMGDVIKSIPFVAGYYGGKMRDAKWASYSPEPGSFYKTNTLRYMIRDVGQKVLNMA